MNYGDRKPALKPVVLGVASALVAMSSLSANAASFELAGFDITFDSTFSYGEAWRIEDRDFDKLIGKSNNQSFDWSDANPNNFVYDPRFAAQYDPNNPNTPFVWGSYGAYSTNGDLGNLNYDPGEAFSRVLKGFHELKIAGDNYGANVSFMYYKDFAVDGVGVKDPVTMQEYDVCQDKKAKELVCQDFRILDAYVYADFDFNDGMNPVSIRVGEQVLSWGESTLIPHGINVSPVDIARLKAPGADLKEAFIPTGMVWANIGLTDSLSLEAFYQYEWQETYLPVAGSYFSTNDFAGAGGAYNNIQLNFASNPDMDRDALMEQLFLLGQGVATGQVSQAEAGSALVNNYPRKYAIRNEAGDKDAKDSGQYGIKLGWFAEELNYTEFGFYYINYHSRRPVISGVASDFSVQAIGNDITTLVGAVAAGQTGLTVEQFNSLDTFTKGILEYPEDIQLIGFSFNTTIGTTAVSGEISHRKDEPIQIDDTELLFAAMPEQLANAQLQDGHLGSTAELLAGISQIGDYAIEGCDLPLGGAQPGEVASGYCLVDTTQAQFTLIQAFGPTLGLDNLAAVFEAGYIQIHDMADPSQLRFNAPGTPRSATTGAEFPEGVLSLVQNGTAEEMPFPTEDAWGYRLILAGELNGVFGQFNLKPRFTFSHDVDGVTPDPLFLFHEDKKSVGVSLDIEYQSAMSFGVSYNSFFDGVGAVNQMADRDYVSFNFKYSL